jgi:hypothetical protein
MRTRVDRRSFCRERARDDGIIVHGPYGSHICSGRADIARDYLEGNPAPWFERAHGLPAPEAAA